MKDSLQTKFSQSVVTSIQVEKVTFPLGFKKGQTISFLANSFKKGQMASQTSIFTVLTIHITFKWNLLFMK